MEVKINKEIQSYSESLFFGLSLRQCGFSLAAMLVAVGLSRFPKIELKEDEKGGSKDSYLALFRLRNRLK